MQTGSPLDFNSVVITGDRVRLVPVSPEYSETIFQEFTDEITRYMVPATPANLQEVDDFIQASISNMSEKNELILAIVNNRNDEFLGICGLHGDPDPDEPVVGIWLKKSAHGHKYGQEAIKILAGWARQNIIFKHLVYPCDKDNIASRKIAESLNGTIFRKADIKSRSGRILHEIAYKIL